MEFRTEKKLVWLLLILLTSILIASVITAYFTFQIYQLMSVPQPVPYSIKKEVSRSILVDALSSSDDCLYLHLLSDTDDLTKAELKISTTWTGPSQYSHSIQRHWRVPTNKGKTANPNWTGDTVEDILQSEALPSGWTQVWLKVVSKSSTAPFNIIKRTEGDPLEPPRMWDDCNGCPGNTVSFNTWGEL